MAYPLGMCRAAKKIVAANLFGVSLMALTIASPEVWAQEAGESANASEGSDVIIVTASRREQDLTEVPASVTVIAPDDYLSRGLSSLQDLMAFAPSVIVEDRGAPGLTRISIRGIASGFAIPTVGIYVDDVPVGSNTSFSSGATFALEAVQNGVERIELVRGPQGTLYGASAMGGILKYVTKEPSTTEFGGRISTDLSTTKSGGFNQVYSAGLNIPLVKDKLAVSVNGFYDSKAGYIDEAVRPLENVNDSELYGGLVSAIYTPTDDLKIKFLYMGQSVSFDNQGRTAIDNATGGFAFGPYIKNNVTDTPRSVDFNLFALTVDYDFDWAQLTLVGSTQESDNASVLDFTGPFSGLVDALAGYAPGTTQSVTFDTGNNIKRDTYELRLQSPNNEKFEWLVGLYYTNEDGTQKQDLMSAPNPANFDLLTLARLSGYKEFAAFANATYYFTPKFDVNVGMRYAKNEQAIEDMSSGFILPNSTPKVGIKDTVDTYLFSVRYRPTEDLSLYARAASGYRPGGKNSPAVDGSGNPIGPQFYKSDSLWSYEIGAKGSMLDGKIAYELAAFWLDWNNQQILIVRDGISAPSNAVSGVTSKGVELSLNLAPTSGLSITGTLAYVDSTLNEDEPDLAALAGETLNNVANWSGSVSAIYDFPISNRLNGFVGVNARFTGDRPAAFSGAPIQFTLPAYSVAGAQAGFITGRYKTSFYVNNAFESKGLLEVNLGGASTASILRPRTFGVVLSAEF